MVQPRILNASSVIVRSREERKKLQIVKNRVWRQILGAPVYTHTSGSCVWGKLRHLQLREGVGRLSWDLRSICFRTSNGLLRGNIRENGGGSKMGRWMR